MKTLQDYGFISNKDELEIINSLTYQIPKLLEHKFTDYLECYFDCVYDGGGFGGMNVGIFLDEVNNFCMVLTTSCQIFCCGVLIYEGEFNTSAIIQEIKKDIVKEFGNNIYEETVKILNQ